MTMQHIQTTMVATATLQSGKNELNEEQRDYPAALPGPEYKMVLSWKNIILFILMHTAAFYGLIAEKSSWATIVVTLVIAVFSGIGITGGAHRLFSHKAYKANLPLRLLLIFLQTIAMQNSVFEWSRDHRVHHKYCDTNADPHNSNRGFFFSHMGWLLCKKHQDVTKFGKRVDMSDLAADGIIMFQHKYYIPLVLLIAVMFPACLLHYVVQESWLNSFMFGIMTRYTITLHGTWLINSAAHMYGMKPFDANISPVENSLIAFIALGEGFHNYHHVFPWDYKTAELGNYRYNITTAFVDFFAWLGWASDLRTVSKDMIVKRVTRTGDGSYKDFPEIFLDENGNEMDVKKH